MAGMITPRMVFLPSLDNLSDEDCEHQVLDRMGFQRFCRLDGVLHIPDARTLWSDYGYKVHSNVDARWKLIQRIQVIAANVDDGQTLQAVLDPANTRGRLLPDRGHDSHANRDLLARYRLRDGIARRAKPAQLSNRPR